MPERPSGTVTFAFTDIEGSTDLLKKLGERYGEVLGEHRQIVRGLFSAADGVEIDTQGDAFFFAFSRARDAVGAAAEVQRAHSAKEWPERSVVRVRIGLHTGEPSVGAEGYVGLDVVRAARICTAGRGGQVLLSETTRALLGASLPEGVSVFPLGERHLKGIDEPERVYELEIEGVETEEAEAQPAPVTPSDHDAGAKLAERIQAQVAQALGGALGGGEGADVEDLAARTATLGDEITARVNAALRAKGIP